MEEYIRLEEEKALSRGETFNWQTVAYGKMEYYEDEDDCFTNFESEFLAIVLDDTSREALSWEPTVIPLNDNEIDFRISFDESDNEDYTYYKDGSHTKVAEAKIRDYALTPIRRILSKTYGVFNSNPYIRYMAPLPAADQRYPWLRYQIEEYTEGIMHMRLRMVYSREGQQVFLSHAWRRLFGIRAPLVREFILEFLSTCRMSDMEMRLDVVDTLCFQLGGELRTSPRVPAYLDNRNTALLQTFDLTVHDLDRFFNEVQFVVDLDLL
ncbi:hypothetical protein Tco_1391639 [Tanacetum coccineum]